MVCERLGCAPAPVIAFSPLVLTLEEVLEGPGPTFVSLQVMYDDASLPGYPSRRMGESMAEVRRVLGQAV